MIATRGRGVGWGCLCTVKSHVRGAGLGVLVQRGLMSGGELSQVSLYNEVLCLEEGGAREGGHCTVRTLVWRPRGWGWSHVRRGTRAGGPCTVRTCVWRRAGPKGVHV